MEITHSWKNWENPHMTGKENMSIQYERVSIKNGYDHTTS